MTSILTTTHHNTLMTDQTLMTISKIIAINMITLPIIFSYFVILTKTLIIYPNPYTTPSILSPKTFPSTYSQLPNLSTYPFYTSITKTAFSTLKYPCRLLVSS